MPTAKSVVTTQNAPEPIGPYSQAIQVQDLLFCSGQTALNPATGEMVGAGDVAAEARQVLDNLAAVLEAGGASFDSIIKTTIFLTDLNNFAVVNKIYGERFSGDPPARSTVEVSRLPKDGLVEIEAVALIQK